MLNVLLAVIIAASLSMSEAQPGQRVTLSVGVQGCAGRLWVEPAAGIVSSSSVITSTAHADRNLALQVLPGALPGVRHLRVRCGDAAASVRLNVVGAGFVVWVPVVRK